MLELCHTVVVSTNKMAFLHSIKPFKHILFLILAFHLFLLVHDLPACLLHHLKHHLGYFAHLFLHDQTECEVQPDVEDWQQHLRQQLEILDLWLMFHELCFGQNW